MLKGKANEIFNNRNHRKGVIMNREQRKLRTDIVFKGCGGLTDALDDAIKSVWYINDEEYDYICEKAKDEELDLFLGGNGKFSDKKKALATVDRLINEMYNALCKQRF